LGSRSVTRAGYNVTVASEPDVRIDLPRRWAVLLFGAAIALAPWILYLTFTLPTRHETVHYDLAWIGFDVGLLASFGATAWSILRGSQWVAPFAAITGTLLCCDAWFDVTTSKPGHELFLAIAEAAFAELPLAALCLYVVYDAERFLGLTVTRFRRQAQIATTPGPRGKLPG
jgi:hypothetical protein